MKDDDELKRIAALSSKPVSTVNSSGLAFSGSSRDAQAFNTPVAKPAMTRPVQRPNLQIVSRQPASPNIAAPGDFRDQLLTKKNAPKGMGWQERMAINEKIAANHGVTLAGASNRAQEAISQAGATSRTSMAEQGLTSRLDTTNAATEALAQSNAQRELQFEKNKQALEDRFSQGKEKRTASYTETAAANDHGRTMALEGYKADRTQDFSRETAATANANAAEAANRLAALEVYKEGGPAHDAALFRNGITDPSALQGKPVAPVKNYKAGSAIVGMGPDSTVVPVTNMATGEITYSQVPQGLGKIKLPKVTTPEEEDEDYEEYLNGLYK